MNDSHDNGISTDSPLRRRQFNKIEFKSLTALSAKDSLENLQKIRRRNDGTRRGFFNRATNSADKRGRKKFRKRFEKPHVSEVNIRKVTDDFVDGKKKLVHIVGSPRKFGANAAGKLKSIFSKSSYNLACKESSCLRTPRHVKFSDSSKSEEPNVHESLSCEYFDTTPYEIIQDFEKLRLADISNASGGSIDIGNVVAAAGELNLMQIGENVESTSAQNLNCAKNVVDRVENGDAAAAAGSDDLVDDENDEDFLLDLDMSNEGLSASDSGMAAAAATTAICDKSEGGRRSVQWNREVDVIYYAGDNDGGKVVRRENEPLREEAEQQAKRNKFYELALTKNLLSNVGACQLNRDPWLVVLPK